MDGIECLRGIDKIVGSLKRVLLTRYCMDDVRQLFGNVASDYAGRYGDEKGDWIADNSYTDPIRFSSQFEAQTYAALSNFSLSFNTYRAAYVPLSPSDSNE